MSDAAPFGSILAGTDFSPTAAAAVAQATGLAARLGARLVIVSAFQPVRRERASEALEAPADVQWTLGPRDDVLAGLAEAAELARAAGVAEVVTFARQGDAADAILDVAEEQACDLIVIGNKGMTGARRFLLGSVPNKVSHHAPCSVLIVRIG